MGIVNRELIVYGRGLLSSSQKEAAKHEILEQVIQLGLSSKLHNTLKWVFHSISSCLSSGWTPWLTPSRCSIVDYRIKEQMNKHTHLIAEILQHGGSMGSVIWENIISSFLMLSNNSICLDTFIQFNLG